MTENPFINRGQAEAPSAVDELDLPEPDAVLGDAVETRGPSKPLAVRDSNHVDATLPIVQSPAAGLHIVGVHGGAGTTTVVQLLGGGIAADAGRVWPAPHPYITESGSGRILLVARANRAGVLALREVLTGWHAGAYAGGLPLLGVCIVDDAPKLTKAQTQEMRALMAMAPHAWHLPWQDSLRLEAPDSGSATARVKWMLKRIRQQAFNPGHSKKEGKS